MHKPFLALCIVFFLLALVFVSGAILLISFLCFYIWYRRTPPGDTNKDTVKLLLRELDVRLYGHSSILDSEILIARMYRLHPHVVHACFNELVREGIFAIQGNYYVKKSTPGRD